MIPIGDTPNPLKTPWVTWGLIAVNVLVYLAVSVPRHRPLITPTLGSTSLG